MHAGKQENTLGGHSGAAELLQEIPETEGESQEHSEEDNDVKALGLLLLELPLK